MLAWLQWATAVVAQALLEAAGTPLARHDDELHHAGGFVAQVHLDCTAWWPALAVMIALAAFGPRARVPLRRLALGAGAAVAVMVVVNQLRLAAVLWTGVNAPWAFAVVHDVAGPLVLVAAGAVVVVRVVRFEGRGSMRARMVATLGLPWSNERWAMRRGR